MPSSVWSASTGTMTTLSICSVTMETCAVMPGLRRLSGSLIKMSTSKVTPLPFELSPEELAMEPMEVTVPWLMMSLNAGYAMLAC